MVLQEPAVLKCLIPVGFLSLLCTNSARKNRSLICVDKHILS